MTRHNLNFVNINRRVITDDLAQQKELVLRLHNLNVFQLDEENHSQLSQIIRDFAMEPSTYKNIFTFIGLCLKTILSDKTGIIYLFHRRECVKLEFFLRQLNIHADSYSAQTEQLRKLFIVEHWRTSAKPVIIIATTAFGLGLDKPDVDFVIQAELFTNVNEIVQMAGRAGRAGQQSLCLNLYSFNDYKE